MHDSGANGNGNTGLILAEIRQLRTEVAAWRGEHDRRIRDLELVPDHVHEAIPERLAERLRAVESTVLRQTIVASIMGAIASGVTLGLAWLTGWVKIRGGAP